MSPIEVDAADDPRIADYVGLTDPELRMRFEADGGFFMVEGTLAIGRLLTSAYRPRSFLLTEKAFARVGADALATGAPVYLADQAVMRQVVGFHIHRGAVAAVHRPPLGDPAELVAGVATVLGVEGSNDHENLGSLFRNAAAFGVGAVLLDPTCADPLYRRAVRVSMGHVLHVPFARTPSFADPARAVIALTPAGDVNLHELPRPTSPVTLLVGAEGPGLTETALATADVRVRIPMASEVDSVNVATAAAIALHHLRVLAEP